MSNKNCKHNYNKSIYIYKDLLSFPHKKVIHKVFSDNELFKFNYHKKYKIYCITDVKVKPKYKYKKIQNIKI